MGDNVEEIKSIDELRKAQAASQMQGGSVPNYNQWAEVLENLQTKLEERLKEALTKTLTDHATLTTEEINDRIRQEVILYAIKMDVDEEMNRLLTHVKEIRRLLSTGGEVGKKLDFMMQELNREANTLGSKASAIEMTQTSLSLKVNIEKMREQVQNLE